MTCVISFTLNSIIIDTTEDYYLLGNKCIERYYLTDSLSYVTEAICYYDSCITKRKNMPEASIAKCIWLCELKNFTEAEQTISVLSDSIVIRNFGPTYKYTTIMLFRIMQNCEKKQEIEAQKMAKDVFNYLNSYLNDNKREIVAYIGANYKGETQAHNYFTFLLQYFYFYSITHNQIMHRKKVKTFYDELGGEMSNELYQLLNDVWSHDIRHFNGVI